MLELTMPGVTEVLTSWIVTPPPTSLGRRSGRYKKKNDCCDESSRDCKFYRMPMINRHSECRTCSTLDVVSSVKCILTGVRASVIA